MSGYLPVEKYKLLVLWVISEPLIISFTISMYSLCAHAWLDEGAGDVSRMAVEEDFADDVRRGKPFL